MALKTYIRKTTEAETRRQAQKLKREVYVKFYRKNGAILFSSLMSETLKLEKYFSVTIHQDSDDIHAWYLEFGQGDYTICEMNDHSLGFSCMKATSDFLELYQVEGNVLKCGLAIMPVVIEEKTLYKLLTNDLIKK